MDKDEIRAIRKSLKFTQERFAQKLGVSYATVNRWENGVSVASSLAIQSIKRLVEERQKRNEENPTNTGSIRYS